MAALKDSIEALAPAVYQSERAPFYQTIESRDSGAIVRVYGTILGGLHNLRFKERPSAGPQPPQGRDPQFTDALVSYTKGEIWRIARDEKVGRAKKGRAKMDRWGRPKFYREGDSRPRDVWLHGLISDLYARLKPVYVTDVKTYGAMADVLRFFFGLHSGSNDDPAHEYLKKLVREVRQS